MAAARPVMPNRPGKNRAIATVAPVFRSPSLAAFEAGSTPYSSDRQGGIAPVSGPIEAGRLECKAVALGFQAPIPRTAALQLGTTFMPLLCLLGAMHIGLALGWWCVLGLGLPAA